MTPSSHRSAVRARLGRGVPAAFAVLALTACGGVQGGSSDASEYPSEPPEMIIPYSPGGGSDLLGRALAEGMEEPLGESIIVVNREGASGALGTKAVATSEPDGYTFGVINATTFSVTPLFQPDQAQSLEDFQVLKALSFEPNIIYTRTESAYESIDDVLALKGTDTGVTFAHSGTGGASLVGQTLFFGKAGIKATGVPFTGGSEIVTAVLGGQVDFGAGPISEVKSQIDAGTVRVIGIFAEERVDILPDVPTTAEKGVDVEIAQMRLLLAPAGLPEEVAEKVTAAADEAVQTERYQAFLEENSILMSDLEGDEVAEDVERARDAIAEGFASIGYDPEAQG
jgi:tripartite-type tricarboxylate transporter receptor subunit TctC